MPRKRVDRSKIELGKGLSEKDAISSLGLAQHGVALDALKPPAGIASAVDSIKSMELANHGLRLDSHMAAALEASKSMGLAQRGLALDALKPPAGIASVVDSIKSMGLAGHGLRIDNRIAAALDASKSMRLAQEGLPWNALKPPAGIKSTIDSIKNMGMTGHGFVLEGFARPAGLESALEASKSMGLAQQGLPWDALKLPADIKLTIDSIKNMGMARYGLSLTVLHAKAISSFSGIADLAEPIRRQSERNAAYQEWKGVFEESIQIEEPELNYELNAEAVIASFFDFIFSRPNVSDSFKVLSEASWFISLDLRSRLTKISSILGKHEQSTDIIAHVNNAFEGVYEESISDLSLVLMKRHPRRAKFIKSAMQAHKSGSYELSVPIFLIQADGVAHDINHELFSNLKNSKKDGYRPNINQIGEFESNKSIVDKILWSPLSGELPVVLPGRKWKGGLNRNMVLHGHDCDYATKENSLKAFSLLSYVSSLLSRITH